jgi:hypothetical protein
MYGSIWKTASKNGFSPAVFLKEPPVKMHHFF